MLIQNNQMFIWNNIKNNVEIYSNIQPDTCPRIMNEIQEMDKQERKAQIEEIRKKIWDEKIDFKHWRREESSWCCSYYLATCCSSKLIRIPAGLITFAILQDVIKDIFNPQEYRLGAMALLISGLAITIFSLYLVGRLSNDFISNLALPYQSEQTGVYDSKKLLPKRMLESLEKDLKETDEKAADKCVAPRLTGERLGRIAEKVRKINTLLQDDLSTEERKILEYAKSYLKSMK